MNFEQIAALVERVAGEELMPRFKRVESRVKADGSLITEADGATQTRLIAELHRLWPEVPVLGEEMTAAQQLAVMEDGRPFWCLDPLDGTTNFAAGLPYFAVSLALIDDGKVTGGVVYDPNRGECFVAERGAGARLNGRPLRVGQAPDALAECVALVDMKRMPTDLAVRLSTDPPFRSQRSFGAVALDWCWMAAGRCHLYLHGRQNLWDYAAGSLVLAEAGGVACLAAGPRAPCDPSLFLGSRTGIGALNADLFDAWRGWFGSGGG